MTYQPDCTLPTEFLEQIAEGGLAVLAKLIAPVVNTAMQLERQQHLGVAPYERSEGRRGQANGYKAKTVATRVGKITLDVPQVREGNVYPQALEKGLRSEPAFKLALAERYVQGVSTRRVAAITEELCGFTVSSTQVSQAAALLDEQLQAWRKRPLGRYRYIWLDAHYEKVRQDGQVRDAAVLTAIGVHRTTNGQERLNREMRRRSRVAALFPNEASCLRLMTAIAMEISEDWQTTRRAYLRWQSDSLC